MFGVKHLEIRTSNHVRITMELNNVKEALENVRNVSLYLNNYLRLQRKDS
jgi:hypothetical protein